MFQQSKTHNYLFITGKRPKIDIPNTKSSASKNQMLVKGKHLSHWVLLASGMDKGSSLWGSTLLCHSSDPVTQLPEVTMWTCVQLKNFLSLHFDSEKYSCWENKNKKLSMVRLSLLGQLHVTRPELESAGHHSNLASQTQVTKLHKLLFKHLSNGWK